ncbi:hypothetical protein [Intrasporangium sp.]|uniref:hypothetical protein n=1 Tax=Intrasporangium sp. TaxID=1925024 RepID=UPI003221EF4F
MDGLRTWDQAGTAAAQALAAAWEQAGEQAAARAAAPLAGAPEALEAAGHIAAAQDRHQAALLGRDGVVAVAPSLKVSGGTVTDTASLTVFVEAKRPLTELAEADRVPAELDGAVTDVIESGPIHALTFDGRVRPALPGFSIGHHDITAGTFGALVRDLRRCRCADVTDCTCGAGPEGDYLILSNNHVLANTNAGGPGDAILQPGPFDGGLFPSDQVATLDRFERIVFGMSGYNLVDAALARPTHSRNVTAMLLGVLVPRGIDQAGVGMGVVKAGRTTQVTAGVVLSTNATVAVNYGAPGTAVFRHQIITTGMSAGGDSGSLLLSRDGLAAVGLLYAGSAVITIHNHISDVETALGVRPVTAPTTT